MLNVNLDPEGKVDDLEIRDDYLTKPKLEKDMSEKNEVPVLTDKPGLEFGTDETKDVVLFGCSLANAVIAALKDGKIAITDFPDFLPPIMKIPAALSGIGKVPQELNDLSQIEKDELIQLVKDNLQVDDAKAELVIEKSINTLYSIYDLVKTVQ